MRRLFAAEANTGEGGGWRLSRRPCWMAPEWLISVSTTPAHCPYHSQSGASQSRALTAGWHSRAALPLCHGTSPSSSSDRAPTLTADRPLRPVPGRTGDRAGVEDGGTPALRYSASRPVLRPAFHAPARCSGPSMWSLQRRLRERGRVRTGSGNLTSASARATALRARAPSSCPR